MTFYDYWTRLITQAEINRQNVKLVTRLGDYPGDYLADSSRMTERQTISSSADERTDKNEAQQLKTLKLNSYHLFSRLASDEQLLPARTLL